VPPIACVRQEAGTRAINRNEGMAVTA